MRCAIVFVAALAAGGVSSTSAAVRVAHLSPDTPAVNVRFGPAGGALSTIITDLTYPNLAPNTPAPDNYLPVPTGNYDIRVDAPSLGAPGSGAITVNALPLNGSTNYTIAAVGTLGSLLTPDAATAPLQPQVYIDDNSIATGQARVRFIHASANTPAVDIVLDANGVNEPGDTVLFGNVARFASGGYLTLNPGTYQLDAFLNDRSILASPALNNLSLSVEANRVYTVWAVGLNALVGQQPANSAQALTVAVTVDAIPAPGAASVLALAGLVTARRRR